MGRHICCWSFVYNWSNFSYCDKRSYRISPGRHGKGETALYAYNGLGHRVGKTSGIQPQKIEYTIDLTRQYHNLLQRTEGESTQTYLWDGNVAGMSVDGHERYYFQDEMGSPIRLLDKNGELEESYGYDEFGQDLYGNQGMMQPFGYTGYQADRVTGTYFAQAREYQPQNGRFTAEDVIKGNGAVPETLNQYAYCLNSPMVFVDNNGEEPELNFEQFQLLPKPEIQPRQYFDSQFKFSKPEIQPNLDFNNTFKFSKPFKYGEYFDADEEFDLYKDSAIISEGSDRVIKNEIESGECIKALDPNATYLSLNKDVPIIMISVEAGVGLYGGFDLPYNMSAELGIKDGFSLESTNISQPIFGYYAGGSIEFAKAKMELGYEYEEYIRMGYVRQNGMVRQAFLSNNDLIIDFGASLYVCIGAGATISINVSELCRAIERMWSEIKETCGW